MGWVWVLVSVFLSSVLFVSFFTPLELEQQVADAYHHGKELHLKGSWPMQAMTWTATNLEARGRLFEVPLLVPVVLSLDSDVPDNSISTYPPVTTHNTTCRPSGGYQLDAGTFGMFIVFSYLFVSFPSFSFFVLCFRFYPRILGSL